MSPSQPDHRSRRQGIAILLVTVAVLAALATACGGGKDNKSLSAGLVKQANSLCADWTKALAELGPNPPLGDVNQMERFTTKVLAVDQSFTARFKELPAAAADKASLASTYASFDTINGAEAAVVSSAQRGDRAGIQSFQQSVIDETGRMNVRLRQLRLNKCSG